MWRVGVLAILSVVFVSEAAEYQYGTQLRRLKRSPHYDDCPPYYPPGPPRFWPPPPRHHHFGPPPFWPPPPPPPQEEPNQPNSQSQAQSSAKSGALMQQPSSQDRGFRQGRGDRGEVQSGGQSQDRGLDQVGGSQDTGNPPCDTCSGKGQQNSAVSNAKSETGSAIAIAVSGKNGRK